jgi:hypothetical protein
VNELLGKVDRNHTFHYKIALKFSRGGYSSEGVIITKKQNFELHKQTDMPAL